MFLACVKPAYVKLLPYNSHKLHHKQDLHKNLSFIDESTI